MNTYLTILCLLCNIFFVSGATATEWKWGSPKVVKTSGDFYATDPGTVAYLPRVGNEKAVKFAAEYAVLPASGKCKISKSGNMYFIVNNQDQAKEKTYLGVTVLLVYPQDMSNMRKSVHLTKNRSDWTGNPPDGRALDGHYENNYSEKVTVSDFLEAHKADNTVYQADARLRHTWHATINDGLINSWTDREFWENPKPNPKDFTEFMHSLQIGEKDTWLALKCYLLQFSTVPNISKEKKLVFYFNNEGASGAWIRLYCPSHNDMFNKDFYINFKP